MKKEIYLIYFIVLSAFLITPVLGVTASIKDSSFNTVNLYYTGSSSSDPGQYYLDGVPSKGNPNVGIELCDAGQAYVGAAYAINVGGSWQYALITYASSSEALSYTSQSGSAAGCYFTPIDFLTFSPYLYTTPNPDVYVAAFPGRLYVAYETSANPGTLSNFVFVGNNGYLRGSYTVPRSFDESTCTISISEPTISFQYYGGSFSAGASDSNVGISNERRMVIGVCTDDQGSACNDGTVLSSATFPLTLGTGLTGSPCVNDQATPIDRYVVINGLGNYICIGPNLKVSITQLSPNPVYYNQTLTISYRITNPRDTPYETQGGNVRVTTDFTVRVSIFNASNPSQIVYENVETITDDIPVNGAVDRTLYWRAAVHSGTYTVKVEVDYGSAIGECNEGDNSAQQNFEVKPVVIPEIWINGNKTDTFPYPGRPYNFSLYLRNSDNETLRNAYVKIVEKNGLSLFTPTQIWDKIHDQYGNKTKNATIVTSITEVYTDYYGWVNITLIPTGNRLFAPEYAYTNASQVLGNYSLYLTGRYLKGNIWEDFKFVINDQLLDNYPLNIQNPYTYKGYDKEIAFHNQKNFVEVVMDFVYTVFANFWKAIVK